MSRLRNIARKWHIPHLYQALRIDKLPQRREHARIKSTFRYGEDPSYLLPLRSGGCHFLISDKEELGAILYSSSDLKMIDTVLKVAPSKCVIWDVGANVGVYSLVFAMLGGSESQVVSFEPEAASRNRLIENINANAIQNIVVLPVALANENRDKVPLSVSFPATSGTHRLGENNSGLASQYIEVLKGDDAMAKFQLPAPNIIKIDVEGYEEQVLLGMKDILSGSSVKGILCEMHFSILSQHNDSRAPARIKQMLKDYGFKIRWLDRSHLFATR